LPATPYTYLCIYIMDTLVNKVAASGIITIDLAGYLPAQPVVAFDLKDYLFMGLILKEKDYREALKQLDTIAYNNTIVAVHCSADAIIPQWAYMLAAATLQPVAHQVCFGTIPQVTEATLLNTIASININEYEGQRLVIKGCGDASIPASAYLAITQQLLPVAKSIMYGEPCSTVPVYKRK
jgi:hypothetical protein